MNLPALCDAVTNVAVAVLSVVLPITAVLFWFAGATRARRSTP